MSATPTPGDLERAAKVCPERTRWGVHSPECPKCPAIARALAEAREEGIAESDALFIVANQRAERAEAQVAALKEALQEMWDIRAGSNGVVGWHHNGDVATWDEFDCVNIAENVLSDTAQAAAQHDARIRKSEREMCAKLCEDSVHAGEGVEIGISICTMNPTELAAAIRARKT